jgi:hypothetical protein
MPRRLKRPFEFGDITGDNAMQVKREYSCRSVFDPRPGIDCVLSTLASQMADYFAGEMVNPGIIRAVIGTAPRIRKK